MSRAASSEDGDLAGLAEGGEVSPHNGRLSLEQRKLGIQGDEPLKGLTNNRGDVIDEFFHGLAF
jgi:hypothetical protein